MDEPETGLDRHALGLLESVVGEVTATGGAVVMTTHSLAPTVGSGRRLTIVAGAAHEEAAAPQGAGGAVSFFGPVLALVWKDVLLELRTRDFVVPVLVFSLMTVVIFSFAFDPTPRVVALVAPGVLWVAIVFGGVVGLTRSFSLEKDNGSLTGLMLAPVSRDTIYFGKMLAAFLFMVAVEIVVFPVFIVLYDMAYAAPEMVPIALLTTLGIAAVGTLFSAMAVNTRAREVMLPILFFPVALPIVVAAVESTSLALGPSLADEALRWIGLLTVFDAVFLVVCPLALRRRRGGLTGPGTGVDLTPESSSGVSPGMTKWSKHAPVTLRYGSSHHC